ncbi:MAG: 30S ribosomal protein S16, partial [Propionibacteriaceae bacterium]|nr:30S ribosomal protein S16 [Propionibacteriaceae bacterium]
PKNDPSVISVKSERVQYWLSVGAQPTEAVVAILKRTGDWQKFTGDDSPSGVTPQKSRKDKLELFNIALAEADAEPAVGAISKSKKQAEAEAEPAEVVEEA